MKESGLLGLSLAICAWFGVSEALAADVSAWCPEGQRTFASGDYDAANLALNSCLNSPPADPTAAAEGYRLRGQTYVERLDYQAALSDFERAIELAPDSSDAWRSKAWVHYKLNELHASVTAIERGLEIDAHSTETHHIHALILTAMGREDAAMDAYDLAYSFEDRETVQNLQQALASQDYKIGVIDGVYGARTREALKACIADGCSIQLQ